MKLLFPLITPLSLFAFSLVYPHYKLSFPENNIFIQPSKLVECCWFYWMLGVKEKKFGGINIIWGAMLVYIYKKKKIVWQGKICGGDWFWVTKFISSPESWKKKKGDCAELMISKKLLIGGIGLCTDPVYVELSWISFTPLIYLRLRSHLSKCFNTLTLSHISTLKRPYDLCNACDLSGDDWENMQAYGRTFSLEWSERNSTQSYTLESEWLYYLARFYMFSYFIFIW